MFTSLPSIPYERYAGRLKADTAPSLVIDTAAVHFIAIGDEALSILQHFSAQRIVANATCVAKTFLPLLANRVAYINNTPFDQYALLLTKQALGASAGVMDETRAKVDSLIGRIRKVLSANEHIVLLVAFSTWTDILVFSAIMQVLQLQKQQHTVLCYVRESRTRHHAVAEALNTYVMLPDLHLLRDTDFLPLHHLPDDLVNSKRNEAFYDLWLRVMHNT